MRMFNTAIVAAAAKLDNARLSSLSCSDPKSPASLDRYHGCRFHVNELRRGLSIVQTTRSSRSITALL